MGKGAMKSELHPVYYYYARHVGHHGRSEYKKNLAFHTPHIHIHTHTQKRNHELFEKVEKKGVLKKVREKKNCCTCNCMYVL